LDLSNNQLTGEVSLVLGPLAALKELYLQNNQLTGEVPAALGKLAALKQLYLDNNQLMGAVPAALGQLAALKYLYLYNNQLTSVPAALMQQQRPRRIRALGRGRRPSRLAVSCHYDQRVIHECEYVESLGVCT
jgi:hypothetical protein